jgi:tricarballylate dehydrogenase
VRRFNRAVQRDVPFNPNVLDGRSTLGIDPPKSNWALPLEQGPFEAYQVTCGITFTFGGVRTDTGARVIDGDGRVMPGQFACGEMLGGLFYLNYPGGSGLTAGSVFGRIAGVGAAGAIAKGP